MMETMRDASPTSAASLSGPIDSLTGDEPEAREAEPMRDGTTDLGLAIHTCPFRRQQDW